MILMLGEILVTKHLSLKHCVHCNAAALAWDHAVSELCKAGRQGLIMPITWLESLLMGPIKHAPNGCQSQGVDMYSFIHDMRLPCGPHHHNLPRTHDQTTTYPKLSCSRDKLCTARRRWVCPLTCLHKGWVVCTIRTSDRHRYRRTSHGGSGHQSPDRCLHS